MNLQKEFLLYPEALELKQLRFDEPCFGWYDGEYKDIINYDRTRNSGVWLNDSSCSAPTYSQAFHWFRQNGYRFNIVNDSENINGYYYYDVWYNGQFMFESHYIYSTYEEAELACLRKLIELFKNK